jgi:hypothetical protein
MWRQQMWWQMDHHQFRSQGPPIPVLLRGIIGLGVGLLVVGGLPVPPLSPSSAVTSQRRSVPEPAMRVEVHLQQRQVILFRGTIAVKRYEIGIGRPGWETPTGTFRVLQMKRNPIWINPFTNEAVPGNDPRNPLRGYWIGFWTDGNNWVGFHGTLDPNTIGKAASHGCLHMHTADLQDLFSRIRLGTPIIVIVHGEINAGRGFT